MNLFRRLVVLGCCAFALSAQEPSGPNTVTLSVGGVGGGNGGPTFNGAYEYRILKYLSLEAGVSTMLPSITNDTFIPVSTLVNSSPSLYTQGSSYVVVPLSDRDRVTMLPFGFKGILPLSRGRIELFSGLGGAYARKSSTYYSPHAWFGQASIGGRVALDRGRRFWLGTTWRYFTDFRGLNVTDGNWYSGTADVGIRFGH